MDHRAQPNQLGITAYDYIKRVETARDCVPEDNTVKLGVKYTGFCNAAFNFRTIRGNNYTRKHLVEDCNMLLDALKGGSGLTTMRGSTLLLSSIHGCGLTHSYVQQLERIALWLTHKQYLKDEFGD